jgi:hypothetical protein
MDDNLMVNKMNFTKDEGAANKMSISLNEGAGLIMRRLRKCSSG